MTFSDDPRKAIWDREKRRLEAGEPPPNWNDPPRRHHYVPEVYLKRFAAPGRKRTHRLSRIDKAAGPTSRITIGVRDAAVEADFYKIETEDPRRNQEAEHVISVFESAAALAFANFDSFGREHFPDAIDRENLAHFAALQYSRGHRTSEFLSDAMTKVSRLLMRTIPPERVRDFLTGRNEDASGEAVANTTRKLREASAAVSVAPHQNTVVKSIINGAVEFAPYFLLRRWVIVCTDVPLLTSDQPIVLVSLRDRPSWSGVGLENADQIIYPLDRFRALVMEHPASGRREAVINISASAARSINVSVANAARRWIFCHPEDRPLDGVPFDPRGRASKDRGSG